MKCADEQFAQVGEASNVNTRLGTYLTIYSMSYFSHRSEIYNILTVAFFISQLKIIL